MNRPKDLEAFSGREEAIAMLMEQLESLVALQQGKVRAAALAILPHLTDDDLLQPNDFPELEHHPYFRHEEGVLEGMMSARALLQAWKSELVEHNSKKRM